MFFVETTRPTTMMKRNQLAQGAVRGVAHQERHALETLQVIEVALVAVSSQELVRVNGMLHAY